MDGFTGFKTATAEELLDTTAMKGSLPCHPTGRRGSLTGAADASSKSCAVAVV